MTITAAPNTPTISSPSITECEKSPLQTLTAVATSTSTGSVVWFDGLTSNTIVISPTLSTVGTKTYYAQNNVGSCSSLTRTPVVLTITGAPSAPTISSPSITECEKSPLQTLTAVATSTGSVVWYDGLTSGTIVTSPTLSKVGTKTYYAQNNVGSCSSLSRTPVVLTITGAPLVPVNAGNITQCEQNPLQTLTAVATSTGGVVWYDGLTSNTIVTSPTLSAVGIKTYYAQNNVGSCSSLFRAPVVLTITGVPLAPTGNNIQSFCSLPVAPMVSDLVAQGTTFNWYSSSVGGVLKPTTENLVEGTHYFASQKNLSGCESTSRLDVLVHLSALTVSEKSRVKPYCGHSDGLIVVEASNGIGNYTYEWNNGSFNDTISKIGNSNYIVIVTDEIGCKSELTFELTCKLADIPQVISPNGNGKNDTWILHSDSKTNVSIYNRWGTLVYKALPYLDDWNGQANQGLTLGNNGLPSGTYFYIIDRNDGEKPLSGYIELIK